MNKAGKPKKMTDTDSGGGSKRTAEAEAKKRIDLIYQRKPDISVPGAMAILRGKAPMPPAKRSARK